MTEKGSFDVLVTLKLDCLSRSVLDLLKLIREELSDKDVVFIEEHRSKNERGKPFTESAAKLRGVQEEVDRFQNQERL